MWSVKPSSNKNGFVILEHITIGVWDVCGNRYYSADILHAVHALRLAEELPNARNKSPWHTAEATESV